MRSHAKAVLAVLALLLTLALGVTFASATAPVVTIEAASSISYTSAHVSGKVNPEDQETFYYFQYSADPTNEGWTSSTFQGPIAAGAGVQNVSDDLAGLKPGTEYEVRLVAENFVDPAQTISAEPNPSFTTEAVGPPTVSIDPVTTFTGTSAHFVGHVNPNAPEAAPVSDPDVEAAFSASWHFECTPACPGLQGGTVAADNTAHTVEADTTGLQPNTDYEVTLVTSNAAGPLSAGPAGFKTEGVAPEVQTLYAGSVGTESATLAAYVNPRNSPLTYQFEWGTDESYGNVTSLTSLGASDDSLHLVTAPLSGLAPGTTYHFRVVATNTDTAEVAEGADIGFVTLEPAGPPAPACPNAAFRTGPSQRLPDCRAYEKVSPALKNGLNVALEPLGIHTALSDRVGFGFRGSPPDAAAGVLFATALGSRDSLAGWSSAAVDPPAPPGVWASHTHVLTAITAAKSVVEAGVALTPDATDQAEQLFLRDNADGSFQLLTPKPGATGPTFPPSELGLQEVMGVGGISSDAKHVVYETSVAQTSDPIPANTYSIYEWVDGLGVRLASVLPDSACGAPPCIAPNGARPGAGAFAVGSKHALSRDGSRIFFHTTGGGPQPRAETSGQIYVRENGSTTEHVSASQRTDCATDPIDCGGDGEPDPAPDPAGTLPALWWDAEAEHGDRTIFTSCEKLTDDSTADSTAAYCTSRQATGAGAGSDLYLYDVDSDSLTDLTTADPNGADVFGVVNASADLQRIYFVAGGVLDAGAPTGGPKLYLWDHGVIKYLATLDETPTVSEVFNDGDNWALREQIDANRLTPDGSRLLFTSRAQLTSYNNSNPECYAGRCAVIYLYDVATDAVVCVSCNPTGEPPLADASLYDRRRGSLSPEDYARNLSTDGERAYFQTQESLVLRDSNGKQDVYQWHDGDVRLISTGTGQFDSFFADATDSGDDVFLLTYDQLTAGDADNLVDIYDARVGGGVQPPPPLAPACEGDACQSPSPPPIDQTPASSAFSGQGRSTAHKPVRCAKSKVRRKGRCVSRSRHRKHGRATKHKRGSHS